MSTPLEVGHLAPDFKAQAYVAGQFKDVALKDYQGKWVALFFYPLDFTFVRPTEIRAFADFYSQFKELGCEVVACSTDSAHSHKAWFERDLKDVKVSRSRRHRSSRLARLRRAHRRSGHRSSRYLPDRPQRHPPVDVSRTPRRRPLRRRSHPHPSSPQDRRALPRQLGSWQVHDQGVSRKGRAPCATSTPCSE